MEKDIKIKARWFCRKYYYLNFEVDDIEQDLRLLELEKKVIYDAKKGSYRAFIATSMNNYLKNRLRAEMRKKRYPKALSNYEMNKIPDPKFNDMANYFSEDFLDEYMDDDFLETYKK